MYQIEEQWYWHQIYFNGWVPALKAKKHIKKKYDRYCDVIRAGNSYVVEFSTDYVFSEFQQVHLREAIGPGSIFFNNEDDLLYEVTEHRIEAIEKLQELGETLRDCVLDAVHSLQIIALIGAILVQLAICWLKIVIEDDENHAIRDRILLVIASTFSMAVIDFVVNPPAPFFVAELITILCIASRSEEILKGLIPCQGK